MCCCIATVSVGTTTVATGALAASVVTAPVGSGAVAVSVATTTVATEGFVNGVERSHGVPGAFSGPNVELSGCQQRGALDSERKMGQRPCARWPARRAVGVPLERRVRRHSHHLCQRYQDFD